MRGILGDNIKNFICYRHLIERNIKDEKDHPNYPNPKEIVKLPFILIETRDTP